MAYLFIGIGFLAFWPIASAILIVSGFAAAAGMLAKSEWEDDRE